MDCLVEMQQCWASSLPIVSLVSFLVGVILAFQAAIQLRQFGAAVFVADLVGLAVVREMGPMMAAVVVAGGTEAGFAAQLGNMKVDQEIDALETLGISSVDFLALPRLLAAAVMMPILALYANVLGILGGMFVSATMLDIPAMAYWIETQNRVGFSDVTSGCSRSDDSFNYPPPSSASLDIILVSRILATSERDRPLTTDRGSSLVISSLDA
jgi:phospholipid/cholesterol/gamma-HCH transport system permease protein